MTTASEAEQTFSGHEVFKHIVVELCDLRPRISLIFETQMTCILSLLVLKGPLRRGLPLFNSDLRKHTDVVRFRLRFPSRDLSAFVTQDSTFRNGTLDRGRDCLFEARCPSGNAYVPIDPVGRSSPGCNRRSWAYLAFAAGTRFSGLPSGAFEGSYSKSRSEVSSK